MVDTDAQRNAGDCRLGAISRRRSTHAATASIHHQQSDRALIKPAAHGHRDLQNVLSAPPTPTTGKPTILRGAYSYVKVGGGHAQQNLASRSPTRSFFAGEATDITGYNGTVHGAMASGQRAAEEIIRAIA